MNENIEAELLALLKNCNSPPKGNRVMGFLNSPLFITAIAGAAISILSLVIQNNYANKQREMELIRSDLQAKREVMLRFSDHIIRFLESTVITFKRKIYLVGWAPHGSTAPPFVDGLAYTETRDKYREDLQLLSHFTQPDTLCAQVKASFRGSELHAVIDDLDITLDGYKKALDEETLSTAFSGADRLYQRAIYLMATEINTALQN